MLVWLGDNWVQLVTWALIATGIAVTLAVTREGWMRSEAEREAEMRGLLPLAYEELKSALEAVIRGTVLSGMPAVSRLVGYPLLLRSLTRGERSNLETLCAELLGIIPEEVNITRQGGGGRAHIRYEKYTGIIDKLVVLQSTMRRLGVAFEGTLPEHPFTQFLKND